MMSKENQKLKSELEDEALICETAAECIEEIDAKGGVCCRHEGVIRVARKILDYCERDAEGVDGMGRGPGDMMGRVTEKTKIIY